MSWTAPGGGAGFAEHNGVLRPSPGPPARPPIFGRPRPRLQLPAIAAGLPPGAPGGTAPIPNYCGPLDYRVGGLKSRGNTTRPDPSCPPGNSKTEVVLKSRVIRGQGERLQVELLRPGPHAQLIVVLGQGIGHFQIAGVQAMRFFQLFDPQFRLA